MEAKKDSSEVASKKIQYPECNKGGSHVGEFSNLYCLEQTCKENNIICCICYEEAHKKHNVKPLKFVLEELDKKISSNPSNKLNADEINPALDTFKMNVEQSL